MPGLGKDEQHRKLFIGGLDYRTTDDSLKAFYEQWGEIVDVIVMKDPQTKRSRGFGFVTYAQPGMVDDAMANRPHVVDGREVEAKRAIPRDESGRAENNVTVKKIFVGGIKEGVRDDDLHNYFGSFGDIVSVSLPQDKATGKQRGFAFIEFKDYDTVDKIILQKNHEVCGKFVDVKKALSKQEMSEMGSGGRGRGGFRGGRGGGGGGSGPWGEGSRGGGGGGGPWDSSGGQWGGGYGGQGGGYGGQGGGYGGQGYGGGQGGGYGGQGGGFGGQGGYGGGYGGGGAAGGYGGGYGGQGGGYDGGYGGGAGGWGGPQGGGGGGGYGGGYGGGSGGGPVKSFGQSARSSPYNSSQRGGGGYGGGGGGGYNRF